MKVTIELCPIEDKEDMDTYVNAPKYKAALLEFRETHLRRRIKYDLLKDNEARLVEKIQEDFFSVLDSYDISII